MLGAFRQWLDAVPIADELRRRHALTLQLLFLFIGIAVPASWLPKFFQPDLSLVDAISSLVIAALAWVAFGLLRFGRYPQAVWMFLGALQLALVVVYANTGLLAQLPAQAPHSLGLLLAALLIGRRALWGVFLSLLLAVMLGMHFDLMAGHSRALHAATSVLLSLLLVSIVLDRFTTVFLEVLQRERDRTQALDEANARIRAEAADRERLQRALNIAQQRDAAELVGSGLAHELNNVLALSYAQLAKAEPAATEEQARALARVKGSLDEAAERISRVLNLVRRDEVPMDELDPADVLRRLEPDLRALLGPSRQLNLKLQPVPRITASETDLAQILMALIANAAQATEPGGCVSIELFRHTRADHDGVLLRVSDDGCGMSPERIVEASQSLFAGSAVRATGNQGQAGLGLVTCRALAERIGGNLAVQSVPGHGTEVELWLPLPCLPHRATTAMAVDPKAVLLVDDDPDVGALLSYVLTRAGFNVEIAETAGAARLAQQSFSLLQPLLVMDRNLPDGDGVSLLEEFSRNSSGLRVVFSSVQALKAHERERLKQIHLVELAKPYVPERLVEALRELGEAA